MHNILKISDFHSKKEKKLKLLLSEEQMFQQIIWFSKNLKSDELLWVCDQLTCLAQALTKHLSLPPSSIRQGRISDEKIVDKLEKSKTCAQNKSKAKQKITLYFSTGNV